MKMFKGLTNEPETAFHHIEPPRVSWRVFYL